MCAVIIGDRDGQMGSRHVVLRAVSRGIFQRETDVHLRVLSQIHEEGEDLEQASGHVHPAKSSWEINLPRPGQVRSILSLVQCIVDQYYILLSSIAGIIYHV
jgi:hypothetical protein